MATIKNSNIDNGSACSACTQNIAGAPAYQALVNAVTAQIDRSADQLETVLSDNLHNEVNNRPAAQQWAVCNARGKYWIKKSDGAGIRHRLAMWAV